MSKIEQRTSTRKANRARAGQAAKEFFEGTQTINGVPGFREHGSKPGWWIYIGRIPFARCIVIPRGDSVEIHDVVVCKEGDRRQGHGTAMIADIRQAFPGAHIWVDTSDCARPFWQKMVARGHIDSIENDYSWPCFDTTCAICHPTRTTGRRRSA
jgi:hypothetical protein